MTTVSSEYEDPPMSKGARNRTTKPGGGSTGKTGSGKTGTGKASTGKSGAGKTSTGKSGTARTSTGSARGGGSGRNRTSRVALPKERNYGNYIFFGAIGLVCVVFIGFAWWLSTKPPIDGLEVFDKMEQGHTTSAVKYEQTPPVGGKHDPTWQNCGVYDKQLRNENAVHSLEHGAVWITYRPGLPADQLNKLKQTVQGNDYTLLSPYPGLDSPIVLNAWGNQLKIDNASDKRLNEFLKMFVQGKQTPEPGALCSQGKATP